MSLDVIAELEIMPQYREELMPVLEALVAGSRAEAGNSRYELAEDLDEPCRFFVQESWASAEALESHNATPHFQAFAAAISGKTTTLRISKIRRLL